MEHKNQIRKKLKEGVYRHWRYIKYLAGNGMYQYEKNIPSDGQIDRLQIVNYPRGGGELRDHVDHARSTSCIWINHEQDRRDFNSGGFCFRQK